MSDSNHTFFTVQIVSTSVYFSLIELKIEQINGKAQIIRTNGDGDPIPLGVKIFKCDECNRIFNDKHLLKDHLIRHAERRKFDVGESINQMNQKGPFKCQLCDKMYGRKQHLCEHLVRHVLLSKGGELKQTC